MTKQQCRSDSLYQCTRTARSQGRTDEGSQDGKEQQGGDSLEPCRVPLVAAVLHVLDDADDDEAEEDGRDGVLDHEVPDGHQGHHAGVFVDGGPELLCSAPDHAADEGPKACGLVLAGDEGSDGDGDEGGNADGDADCQAEVVVAVDEGSTEDDTKCAREQVPAIKRQGNKNNQAQTLRKASAQT